MKIHRTRSISKLVTSLQVNEWLRKTMEDGGNNQRFKGVFDGNVMGVGQEASRNFPPPNPIYRRYVAQ
jgi:hypothetical protein